MGLKLDPALAPDARLLAVAVALDLAIGDPSYPAHPVRLIGWTLSVFERWLRRLRLSGYVGGVALFCLLAVAWAGGLSALVAGVFATERRLGRLLHLFLLYSLLALGELLRYGWRVERALRAGDLVAARRLVSGLVGRDTEHLEAAACRRAVVESWSENLTDGFVSPVFWYAILGLPGLVLFKVVSTMDSMVGYKTPLYLRFGWCGARTDDVMSFLPARLAWLTISLAAALVPGGSGARAWRIGLAQHGRLPSPNSGWSEAAAAGGLSRKLVGPIWAEGRLVTEIWIGDPSDPPLEGPADMRRAAVLVTVAGLLFATLAFIVVSLRY